MEKSATDKETYEDVRLEIIELETGDIITASLECLYEVPIRGGGL